MSNDRSAAGFDYPFMDGLSGTAVSMPGGHYCLSYNIIGNEGWSCEFVSGGCLKILGCSREEFLDELMHVAGRWNQGAQEKDVRTALGELSAGKGGSGSFVGVRRAGNGETMYLRGALSVWEGPDGGLRASGGLDDLTGVYREEQRRRMLEEEYRIGLEMSGRSIYRYMVDGRRGIVPPEIARRGGIPEVIDNLPEWNVACGRIAPQSVDAWLGVFDSIHRGDRSGMAEVVFLVRGGTMARRGQVEFTSILDGGGNTVSAIITHKDVTDEYERGRAQTLDRDGLLYISQMTFPEILSVNLTRGTYRMIQYYGATALGTPQEGPLDQMLGLRLSNVAEEDRQAFKDAFFRQGLMEAVRMGREKVQLTYRRRGQDGVWHWMETTAMRQANPYDGDILIIAVSRNVDRQKEDEEKLRRALESTSEQLEDHIYYDRTASGMFPGLGYFGYADGRASPLVVGTLAQALNCDPAELALCRGGRIHPEDREALGRARAEAERAGKNSFHAEYRVEDGGEYRHISNHALSFVDREGSGGYLYFLTDTTYEHALSETLRLIMEEKVKETEQVFRIVAQHSSRALYSYDLSSRTTRPYDEGSEAADLLAHLHTGAYSEEGVRENQGVLPESVPVVQAFFEDIHAGKPSGEANVHIRLRDGERRWLHFMYSSLFAGDQPTVALISVKDVTDQHEQEISHLRFINSIGEKVEKHVGYMEADLTADIVEKQTGLELWGTDASSVGRPYSEFTDAYKLGLSEPEDNRAHAVYSRENLLSQYERGVRNIDNLWHVERPAGRFWIKAKTELMADPFTGHIKLFVNMSDVTAEEEERLAVAKRADHDTMTGLLRRGVGEERIRQLVASNHGGEKGGILIVLDLDDLKGINDTLGHEHGDRAIRGIANALREHFRRDDVLVRAGGDEFMAYLPGAGQSASSVALSMTALLRKLAGISIGGDDGRNIHCSAGCAVEQPGKDTFESLYRRADQALYHVKRNGKNSFAFFEPEMLRADYRFKLNLAAPKVDMSVAGEELRNLLKMVSVYFPGIVSFNLTGNQFMILETEPHVGAIPLADTIDVFWKVTAEKIHPEDREGALDSLSRKRLLAAYEEGKPAVRHPFRYRERPEDDYHRAEANVSFYNMENGDICAFAFFKRDLAPERTLEVLRLKKLLELSLTAGFEYICLIDVRNRAYSTYSRDGFNTHSIPEAADFDMVTRHIRDTQIRPGERDAYYEAAALDKVLSRMNGPEGRYSYRYALKDGVREAFFTWYEESRSELLMTVRKV